MEQLDSKQVKIASDSQQHLINAITSLKKFSDSIGGIGPKQQAFILKTMNGLQYSSDQWSLVFDMIEAADGLKKLSERPLIGAESCNDLKTTAVSIFTQVNGFLNEGEPPNYEKLFANAIVE